jgi:hypothetical protein
MSLHKSADSGLKIRYTGRTWAHRCCDYAICTGQSARRAVAVRPLWHGMPATCVHESEEVSRPRAAEPGTSL